MQPVIIPISAEVAAAAMAALTTAVSAREPEPCPCCVHLIRALTAVSRATSLIQAAQIAEGALRGDVGTATQDVV
jgi:hypothetical protein